MFQLDSDFWSWFNVSVMWKILHCWNSDFALLKLVVSCIDLLDSNLNLFSKNSGFKYVVSCNCIQIWNCFLEILIWDMLFPALFYLVMKVWIRIIFEILYFSLVLSLRCYLLMDIGVELEQWSSLLVPRRFCDQFARANFCSLELTVPGSEWPSSGSHNFWIVRRNLEFYIPLESSRSKESNGILYLMIKGWQRKWIFWSKKN